MAMATKAEKAAAPGRQSNGLECADDSRAAVAHAGTGGCEAAHCADGEPACSVAVTARDERGYGQRLQAGMIVPGPGLKRETGGTQRFWIS